MPDYRYVNTPSILEPTKKAERSKLFSSAFLVSNLLRSESHFNDIIGHLLNWLDAYAESRKPMHFDQYCSYVALDIAGEAMFSQPFGFISEGRDIGNHIKKSCALNRYAAVAGYFWWLHVLLVANPIMTWLGFWIKGHVLATLIAGLRNRRANPDARFDVIAHWLKVHEHNHHVLSFRDIEAQVIVTLSAASDTVSCEFLAILYSTVPCYRLQAHGFRCTPIVCLPYDPATALVGASAVGD